MRLRHEPLDLVTTYDFRISSMGARKRHENLLVRLEHDGLEGLGEAAPSRYYGESRALAGAALDAWAPHLGEDPFALEALGARLDSVLGGSGRPAPRSTRRCTTGSAGSWGFRCGGSSGWKLRPRRAPA